MHSRQRLLCFELNGLAESVNHSPVRGELIMFARSSWCSGLLVVVVGLQMMLATIANADVVVTSVLRRVDARATGAAPDTNSSAAAGFYTYTAIAPGAGPAGTIISNASQASTTPLFSGPTVTGNGAASVSAAATGTTGFSNFSESFFELFFTVSATGSYRLDGSVFWGGGAPPPYTGFATIELWNQTSNTLIDSVTSSPSSPGTNTIGNTYALLGGVSYRLLAEVEISGGFATAGSYANNGSWDLTFGVPEPASAGMAILLACFLGAPSRRKR